jgi:hypothetical protein
MASLATELDLPLVEKDYFEENPSTGKLRVGPDDPLYIPLSFTHARCFCFLDGIGLTSDNRVPPLPVANTA